MHSRRGILGICVLHWSNCKKGAFVCVHHHGSLVWADLLMFPLHDDTSPWQLLTDYHSNIAHKTCRHSHFYLFLSYDCPSHSFWAQLVGKQLRFKLKKELLSLHHVASGCYPVMSLSFLNFWDMLKFTLVSKTHKINQTDWIKFHLPLPAGWYYTVVSRLKPTLGYITSKDFPGVP